MKGGKENRKLMAGNSRVEKRQNNFNSVQVEYNEAQVNDMRNNNKYFLSLSIVYRLTRADDDDDDNNERRALLRKLIFLKNKLSSPFSGLIVSASGGKTTKEKEREREERAREKKKPAFRLS